MRFLTLLALLVAAPPLWAQGHIVSDRAQCRLSFGNSVRDLATVSALRSEICHRDRMRGKVAVGVDCNDLATWQDSGYIDGAIAFGRDEDRYAAESAQCSPGVQTTAEVGHTSCPAPCESLPVTTFPELGQCLKCVTGDSASSTFVGVLGTPAAPSAKLPRKCQETIGRGIVRYLNKRMNLQHGCQFLKDIGEAPFDSLDCRDVNNPNHPDAERSERARAKLRKQIERRCGAVDFALALDTCASDAAGETDCVLSAVDQWSDLLFDALYPAF